MENYDENLEENEFFKRLCRVLPTLYQDAALHNWIVCVPRCGSVEVEKLIENDFQAHILQSLDQQEKLFCTLNGKLVNFNGKTIAVANEDTVGAGNVVDINAANVLFEEDFYFNSEEKFQVLCIDSPLQGKPSGVEGEVKVLSTVSDCVAFLRQETSDANLLKQIEFSIQNSSIIWTNCKDMTAIKVEINNFYTEIVAAVLQNPIMNRRFKLDLKFKENYCLALETYSIHAWEKSLFQSIVNINASKDADLNRILRKYHDIEVEDLEIKTNLIASVSKCKLELLKLSTLTTPLTKKLHLKRAFDKISSSTLSSSFALSSDELLPFCIYLVLKTPIANWYSQLSFMKDLSILTESSLEKDFLLATLEAAFEHISSGGLSALNKTKWSKYEGEIDSGGLVVDQQWLSEVPAEKDYDNAKALFKLVKRGLLYDLEEYASDLETASRARSSSSIELCHPLCRCDKCTKKTKSQLRLSQLISGFRDQHGRTVFHVAVSFGHDDVVDFLLQNSKCFNGVDSNGTSPLHLACLMGLQKILMLLLHFGADVRTCDNTGNTALHWASYSGHKHCVETLLYCNEYMGSKIDINSANIQGDSALHLAAKWGFVDVVELLLDFGAKVSVVNKSKQLAVNLAHNDHIRHLLFNHKGNLYKSLVASNTQQNIKTNDILVNDKVKALQIVDAVDSRVQELLCAAANDDVTAVRAYLGLSEEVDSGEGSENDVEEATDEYEEDNIPCHPLCQCEKCQNIHKSRKKQLLTSSELLNSCNIDGISPLHVSCAHGHQRIVSLLLSAGALVNEKDSNGFTPLHFAAQNDREQVVKLLLENEAVVNMSDCVGNTPLHYTAISGFVHVAAILLQNGALVNQRNYKGQTVLHLAEDEQMVSLLLTSGADPKVTDRQGQTPKHSPVHSIS
ncbi:hypothetical protein CHUAL_011550 [Chamberlinius hualienensis]